MADAASAVSSTTTIPPDPASTPKSPRGRGRGRSRGRGPRGAGRGRGRGTALDSSHGRPPGGSFGARLTGAAPNNQGDTSVPVTDTQSEAPTDDAEVCFICASPIEHISIAPCNHQTCHICALRLRALYKTRACAHCRTEAPFVIFTDNAEKHFQDFSDQEIAKTDENLGIKYEKDIILEDTILLLRYNCPDKDCDAACRSWPDLQRHVKTKHGKIMCDLCVRNKKVFAHEHEMFTFGELRRHEKYGDDNPGAVDQSGFKGHPECGFCRERFYGDDELYSHCREKHERCHICDRRNGGRNPQYYLNYQDLEKHFAEAHFVCLDAECQANKTNVFESEMDLKAHQLSEHPNGLSKDARRDARLVNLSGFNLREAYQPPRRGHGRGRDPNAEPLPMSSAQPLSRAELAYQRQMAIQSAQSVAPRTFGGSLTQPQAQPQQQATSPRPQPSQPSQPQQTPQPPSLDTLTISSLTPSAITPQPLALRARHEAVLTRASSLLQNDQTKLTQFRNHISSYNNSSISASDLVDSFFSLFDTSSSELGILLRQVADLFENESKRTGLLEAWNNWRSINEDYPSLPLPSGGATTSASGPTLGANVGSGRRVLRLKSSTQQSGRSTTARQASWGTILSGTAANNPLSSTAGRTGNPEAFPSLPSTRKPPASSIAWSTAGTSSKPATTYTTSTAAASRTNTKKPSVPANTAEAFPSLPASKGPINTMIPGINTRSYRKIPSANNSGASTPVNAWGTNRGPTPGEAAAAVSNLAEEIGDGSGAGEGIDGAGGKKGKKGKAKGKGEVLFHFG